MAVFNSSMLQPTEPTLVQAAPAFLVGTWRIEPDVAHPDPVTATVELGDGASLPTTFSDFAGECYLFSRSDEGLGCEWLVDCARHPRPIPPETS